MIHECKKHVLINCSNLHVGGAVAVASSFINSISMKKTLEFDVSILVSTKVMKNLVELGTDISNFRTVTIADFIGISALWKRLDEKIAGFDLVFTVFGPAYSMTSVKNHIVGFAQPSIIYPNSRAFLKVSMLNRFLMRLKFGIQKYFFSRAESLVVELEHVKVGLRKMPSFRSKDIYVVNSAVDSVFSDPDRWLPINNTNLQSSVIKLGLISRNYPHKNIDLLPYIKSALKKNHNIEAEFFVTFVPDEWAACTEHFRKTINNVGPLTLAQCPKFYESMDGVVFPSLLECFSAVPIESMLMKKPLFSSDLPFIRDCCKNHANYFKPEDAVSAASVIAEFFAKSSDERTRLIDDAQEFVSLYPSATDRAESYINLMRHMLRF